MANILENEFIKAVLQDGATQVDENLIINECESAFDNATRKLRIYCKAVNKKTAETVELITVFE